MRICLCRNQKYQIMLAWLCNKYYVLNYMMHSFWSECDINSIEVHVRVQTFFVSVQKGNEK